MLTVNWEGKKSINSPNTNQNQTTVIGFGVIFQKIVENFVGSSKLCWLLSFMI